MEDSIRKRLENLEHMSLCQYATFSDFQRDRDRIIHSKAFRRLKHKTQVFISPRGDHYRTRLTHTLEVSQISRTVARALRLNEDLTEAIALGHDLGHTPFGHAGESALNELCSGGFKHFEQSVRVVSILEKEGNGLNLTYEVIDGILKHTRGPEAETPEGRIVRICDKIAYINHDIEDAIRARALSEIPSEFIEIFGNDFSSRVNSMVTSIIENSSGGVIKMGEEIQKEFCKIHKFMYDEVYLKKVSFSEECKVPFVISSLYKHFINHYNQMPEYLQKIAKNESLERAVCDYIAGMTDQFAVSVFKDVFIPKSLAIF